MMLAAPPSQSFICLHIQLPTRADSIYVLQIALTVWPKCSEQFQCAVYHVWPWPAAKTFCEALSSAVGKYLGQMSCFLKFLPWILTYQHFLLPVSIYLGTFEPHPVFYTCHYLWQPTSPHLCPILPKQCLPHPQLSYKCQKLPKLVSSGIKSKSSPHRVKCWLNVVYPFLSPACNYGSEIVAVS